jgi:hypothetical protein
VKSGNEEKERRGSDGRGGARGSTFLPSTRDENKIFVSDLFLSLFKDIFKTAHLYDDTAWVPELLDIFNSEGEKRTL